MYCRDSIGVIMRNKRFTEVSPTYTSVNHIKTDIRE